MTKFYKILFFNTLILGTLISISAHSWMMMWLGMEINLLSMIPLLKNTKSMYPTEAVMKYFIIQSLASTILLFSIIMMEKFYNNQMMNCNNWMIMILQTALFIKLGMAPFQFWVPEVIEGLNWMNCFIILTWQKIAPSIMIILMFKLTYLMIMSIILSTMLSSMMSITQTSMRKIMAYSSINHMSWMLMTMASTTKLWMIYLILYSLMNLNLIMMFKHFNINSINQMQNTKISKNGKLILMMNLFSLGGLPPFIGFLPKWLVISWMLKMNFILLPTILIMSTLIMIYTYLRITLTALTIKPFSLKEKKVDFIFMMMNFSILISLPIMSMIL